MKSMANKYQSEWFSLHMWDFHGTVVMGKIFCVATEYMGDKICMVEIEQIHINLFYDHMITLWIKQDNR